eukprot:385720-Pelagomonas_calceolata.AAC.1
MPATIPDLSLKLEEKLEVYNCFCVTKRTEISYDMGSVEVAQTVSQKNMPHSCTAPCLQG